MRKIGPYVIFLSFILIFSGSSVFAEGEARYLKNNIHYQERPDRGGKLVRNASYANYTDPGQGQLERVNVSDFADFDFSYLKFYFRYNHFW